MILLLRIAGIASLVGALVVGVIAAGMETNDPAVVAGSWLLANLPLVGAWLTVAMLLVLGLVSFRAARRLHGLALAAEDRRLRNDPRFTQAWVEQLKQEGVPPDPGPTPNITEP